MGSLIGGLVTGGLGLIGSRRQAHQQQRAGQAAAQQARLGFDFLQNNPLIGQLQNQGGDAAALRASLLGLGGDPAAGQAALAQFRNGTGFQDQLRRGSEAITGNEATKGLLESGGTLEGQTAFGQNLAAGSFQDFLRNLMQESGQGLNAAGAVGSAGSVAGGTGANALFRAGQNAADSNRAGFGDFVGLGVQPIVNSIFGAPPVPAVPAGP